jgi:2-keto-4-pentenoate hydratase/2-oxohepta-3-ene-1,7-dioic acid hydratase in catechol pathway
MTPFLLATLTLQGRPEAALKVGERFFPLASLGPDLAGATCLSLLRVWDQSLPRLEQAVEGLRAEDGLPAAGVELLTPVRYPDALFAVGANYSGHLREMGLAVEKWPSMPFFLRPPGTTLVGPGATVILPRSTRQFDWECELAVVAGRPLRHASREEAAGAVAGYAIGLDLSCRDLIPSDNDLKIEFVRGKAQDTMAPCGPAITPAQFVGDVNNLRIRLSVNDETMMNASTSEMLYKLDEQLSIISEYITVQPGDILFTGWPAGSAGVHGDRWLRPGDQIRAEIEAVGVLEVSVRSDQGSA